MMRCFGCGTVVLLGAMVLLYASDALAVTIPADTYTLRVSSGDAATVDLGSPAPFVGTPQWIRLHPRNPTDPVEDYSDSVEGWAVDTSGRPRPSDAWVFDITFTVTWNGTVDGMAPSGAFAEEMLFAIVDSRFGPGMSYDTTQDLPLSGFVRGSFEVNGASTTPEIILDDTGPTSGDPQGFVRDIWDDRAPANNRWIGFYLPAEAGVTHTLTMQWAVGERWGNQDIFFPNALFAATVPEPGTAALVGVALLILGAARARHRAA